MKFLDIQTIIFTHVIIDIVCTLIIASLWYQNRKRFAGIDFLVFDFAFLTAALILIVLRGAIPDWISIVFANILLIAGVLLGYLGLERFVGKKTPQIHNYLLLAAYAVAQTYFTYVKPDLALRTFLSSLGMLILSFQCMWFMLYRVPPGMRQFTVGVGLIFGAYILLNTVRTVEFFAGPHSAHNLFQSGTFQALMLICYQMLFIILTYGITLMVNKRLHIEIRTQEEKFAKAFHSSPYAILITRLSDGQILEVNQGFVDFTGYRYEEAVNRTTLDLHLWAKDEERVVVVDQLSKNGRVHATEFQFRKKSGEEMTGIISIEIITVNNEAYALSSINDITRRKQMEEQLQELNNSLQKQIEEETGRRLAQERLLANHARLAAMGKMIGAIAHQWRQPLSTLGMIVQRLHAAGTLQGLTREQLDEFKAGAIRQVKYMSDTIDEFRNFYLPEKEKTPFHPHACIADAVRLFDPQFTNHGITVVLVCPEDAHHFINGYPNEFKQVILNLLGNARDAILDCRSVHGKPEEGHILLNICIILENVMAIDVTDNGCGIPADIATQIFDPYFTTKEKSGGSGIGLYMSRMIVEESLKGRLSLVQGQGKGTTFRIELPLEEES